MIKLDLPAKYRKIIDISLVENISSLVLHSLSDEEFIISLSFTNNKIIQQLNYKYRGIDKPTDVLSFDMNEKFPTEKMTFLGDIVISVEQAIIQAKTNNVPLNAEISLLLIHGILHLFGYDHDINKNKERMWKIQNELFLKSGISIKYPLK